MTEKKGKEEKNGKKDRKLSDEFMEALKEGVLKPILDLVRNDNTLDLQIRADCINIYYRGGSLLKITRAGSVFKGEFALDKYGKDGDESLTAACHFQPEFRSANNATEWKKVVPNCKHLLDRYFTKRPNEERQIQQLIARENNFGGQAESTDYFICDIEYVDYLPVSKTESGKPRGFRVDLIAIRWPSIDGERSDAHNIELTFIELKYGDGALKGDAGITDHLEDMEEFLSQPNSLASVISQMEKVLRQKIELGLIPSLEGKSGSFSTKRPDYIFILGNHDPKDGVLDKLLKGDAVTKTYEKFKLKFAVSNFMGFGLYEQAVYSLDYFRGRFDREIHSK